MENTVSRGFFRCLGFDLEGLLRERWITKCYHRQTGSGILRFRSFFVIANAKFRISKEQNRAPRVGYHILANQAI